MMKKLDSRTYLYIALAGLVLILVLTVTYMLTPVSKADTTQYVYIDEDDTQDSVIAKVGAFSHTAGMTGLTTLIRHSNYDKHIRTGRYAIEPSEGALVVFRHLKNGRQTSMMLTIPEVRTMDRLAAVLAQKLMLGSATIATALTDQATCLKRMQREHDRFWQGDREQKAAQMQLTPNEVCTLASIIDEETANNAEKPMIAGIYLNRLHEPMPLQADPTIKFALKQFELKRIYNKLLNVDSPYNTYRNEGLPPGPIKVASVKGIDAVLNYVRHDYLYMCAKEDFSGTHNFARTYQEHLKNAARYSQALNERDIK